MKKLLKKKEIDKILNPNQQPKENDPGKTNRASTNNKASKTKKKVTEKAKPRKYLSNFPTKTKKIKSYLQSHRHRKTSKGLGSRSMRSNSKLSKQEIKSTLTSANVSVRQMNSVREGETKTKKQTYLKTFLLQMTKTNRKITEDVMEDFDGHRMKAKKMMLYSNLKYQKK